MLMILFAIAAVKQKKGGFHMHRKSDILRDFEARRVNT